MCSRDYRRNNKDTDGFNKIQSLAVRPSACRVYYRGMGGAAGDLSAFVLAGGKSTRMGADKAFVEYEGRTLLTRMMDMARSVSDNVRIVGSRQKFAGYGDVVEDRFSDCGPLGGIHAALRESTTELNLMLAVDMPFITPHFLHYLLSKAQSADGTVVLPRSAGRLQPLCAFYRRDFAEVAEGALLAGRNKIDPLFSLVNANVIEEEELKRKGFSIDLFRNMNTPEDLRETLAIKSR